MKTVSAITLEEQLDATTGVVASRNRSRLHRLAGASPAANLRPEPAAISRSLPSARAWKSRFARDLSFSSWWWMLDVYRVVSEQFNDELTQLIFAINMASGFQKWRACAGA